VKSLKVCALVAQKCSYNRTNYTEEEEENKEKSNKRTTIKRIEKAPSIEEANELFTAKPSFNVVLLLRHNLITIQ
jgi:hypothetical protein